MKNVEGNLIFKYLNKIVVLGYRDFETILGFCSLEGNTYYICINKSMPNKSKVLHKFLSFIKTKRLRENFYIISNSEIIYKH